MSRTYWNISYQESGGSWVADDTVPRPNASLARNTASNTQVIRLADGSKAFVSPEVYSDKMQLVFSWYYDDGTYKTKIETYIENNEMLKITNHLSEEITGKFLSLKATHLLGISPDTYDLDATFEVTS